MPHLKNGGESIGSDLMAPSLLPERHFADRHWIDRVYRLEMTYSRLCQPTTLLAECQLAKHCNI
jgi:hypothetical protein